MRRKSIFTELHENPFTMTYSELLLTDEWKNRRIEIISRDENRCQKCLNKKYFDQFSFTNLRIRPTKNGSIIQIYAENGVIDEIFTERTLRDFAKFKSKPASTVVVLFKEVDYTLKIVAICSINKNVSQIDLQVESEILLNAEIEEFAQGKNEVTREAIRILLTAYSFDSNILKANALKRHLNSDNLCLSEIRWLDVKNLHVHHKYYQLEKLPWQYPDEALVTLCWSCHEALHREEKVPCLDENGNQISLLTPCSRCYGAGWFPEYNHVQNGVCFECNGAKYEELF